MKKISAIILSLLFVTTGASARVVERSTAEKIAKIQLGSSAPAMVWDGTLNKGEEPVFYVYNNPEGGWIIISAEDSAQPIIAYSYEGSFKTDNMPVNLKSWMGGYRKQILEARKNAIAPDSKVRKMWDEATVVTKGTHAQKTLETAKWDQDTPYNMYCPTVSEEGRNYTALTGCVATAMGIVLRYHRWPEHGTGTIGGYSYTSDYNKKVNIPAYSIDDHYYDYTLMPTKLSSSSSTSQKQQVATLLHDCGVAVHAEYNYNTGTGAFSEYLAEALHSHMGMSGNARLERRDTHSDAEWIRLIKNEIDNNRPILYGGVDPDPQYGGGHQFVCDGYDANDKISINWGWSGSDNGFFTLTLSIPNAYSFSTYQDALIGLEPDRDGSTTLSSGPIQLLAYGSRAGMSISSGSIESGRFTLSASSVYNDNEFVDYYGKYRAVLVDWRGTLKEVISEEKSLRLTAGNLTSISGLSCIITVPQLFGDRVILQFDDNGEWATIRANNMNGLLSATISCYKYAYILIDEELKSGDNYIVDFVGNGTAVESYTWTYDGKTMSGTSVQLKPGIHTISVVITYSDKTKETVTKQISVD